MTYAAEEKAIQSRFAANFTTLPIKWDNVDYAPTPDTSFAIIEIHDGDQLPISVADTVLYRNVGIISINIYTTLNTGSQTAKGYCDTAAAVFRGQQFSSITCRGTTITRLGEIDGWWAYNVSIPFYRDEAF